MSKLFDKMFYNSNGAIDTTSTGYKIIIDTLTQVREKVIHQKFYEIAPADFMPVDVGVAAYMDQIVQNVVYSTDGGFYTGDISNANAAGKLSNVDTAIAPIRMYNQPWAKTTNWTVFELKQAALLDRWDVVESKLQSLKKVWDLGIQENSFLGHPLITTITGLLNDPEVTVDTTTIPYPISSLSYSQFSTFIKNILAAYLTNCNYTTMPNTFVLPITDFAGLGVPVSSQFPNVSMLKYLTETFQIMTVNPKFKILPNAYCEATNNAVRSGMSVQRYALYKDDPETLNLAIPVDFTMLPADTTNQFQWSQAAYGQYSGVLISRKPEVLYFNAAAATV